MVQKLEISRVGVRFNVDHSIINPAEFFNTLVVVNYIKAKALD